MIKALRFFFFPPSVNSRRRLCLSLVRMVCACWDWEEQREIPALSYSDLYQGPVQMVFQESKEWISNSHDYEIVEKLLWRSWNLSGPASWSGKDNSLELTAILHDQCWLKTLRFCCCTSCFYDTVIFPKWMLQM